MKPKPTLVGQPIYTLSIPCKSIDQANKLATIISERTKYGVDLYKVEAVSLFSFERERPSIVLCRVYASTAYHAQVYMQEVLKDLKIK